MFLCTWLDPADVLHQVDAVRLQRAVDALQHVERLRLVVDRVERRDEVERLRLGRLVEVAQIVGDELDVASSPLAAASSRARADRLRGEVHARRSGSRGNSSASRLMIRPLPQPTSSTRMPARQPLGQPGHERQDVRLERRQHGLAAVLGHHLVEARELLVGHAAAVLEALDDVVLDAAEERRCTARTPRCCRPPPRASGTPRARPAGDSARWPGRHSTTPAVTIAPSHSRT